MSSSPAVHLSAAERAVVAGLGREVSFAAGERVVEEGSVGEGFYVVESGCVEVLKGGRPIAELGEGAVLGEMAVFGENVRTAEARALEPSRLLFVPTEELVGLVLRGERAAVEVMQALGQLMVGRLQELDAELARWTGELVAQATSRDSAGAAEEFAVVRKRLLADWALRYHALGKPGKLSVVSSKAVGTAADLSVAYSPGVAEPCLAIHDAPELAYEYTGRGHLVGVVTNGTAVLGLGDIGALASKPVMEGKAVLFKRFADIDAFDVEVDERDPERFVDIVCAIAPTFGGINLEDIRAPECFFIEARVQAPLRHSGVPRRPARDGDHRRGRAPERARARRQGDRGEPRRLLRRRRCRIRLREVLPAARRPSRATDSDRRERGRLSRPRRRQLPRRAGRRHGHADARGCRGRRGRVRRRLGAERAHARTCSARWRATRSCSRSRTRCRRSTTAWPAPPGTT